MRNSGILMPITALPSPWGVGHMGEEARRFLSFLRAAGQSCWQILPINPTSHGDSPYQSFSSFAGNPYLIDLDDLARDGLLSRRLTPTSPGVPRRTRWTTASSIASDSPFCARPWRSSRSRSPKPWRNSASQSAGGCRTTPSLWP